MQVQDLGKMHYADALALQRATHQRVLEGRSPDVLLLLEHDAVITVSQRRSAGGNLLASPQALERLGIELARTDRGGDITYHGPGQLVAYPILRLAPLGLMVGSYMRMLEDIVIATVEKFGVTATRIEKCTGVWVMNGRQGATGAPHACLTPAAASKLCAMGIRVQRNVTLHGLALNVTTDLSHFDTIVPCGIRDRGVTSLRALLGDRCPTMPRVKDELARQFRQHVADRSAG